ncbi:MAG TPA: L,D-transpeptidase [Gillisia sp.]|nr:L,D-transpeptidase [Gillisia sp.]
MKKKIFSYLHPLSAIIFIGGAFISCDYTSGKESPPRGVSLDSVKNIKEEVLKDTIPETLVLTYKLDSIVNIQHRDSLLDQFSENEQRIILLLNRIEKNKIKGGSRVIIPDSLINDLLVYSPMPQNLSELDSIPKAVLIAQRIQAFGLYENGQLIRWGPVSSGKQSTPTPNGLNYANFRSKRKISTVDPTWIMPYYFNFMNYYGVGVHQYQLPGYPASHACVRLDMEDAVFIYHWAEPWTLDSKGRYLVKNGTPFMVFGEYKFDEQVPWLDLANNPDANKLNAAEHETIKNYVTDYMEDEKNFVKEEIPKSEIALGK